MGVPKPETADIGAVGCISSRLHGFTAAAIARCISSMPSGLTALVNVAVHVQELNEETIGDVLSSLQYATEAAQGWAKAWHNWALFNVQVAC